MRDGVNHRSCCSVLWARRVLHPGAWPLPTRLPPPPLLLGAGSALLFGATDELASHSHGHNKRLALLPAGFNWVTRANKVPAVQFWDPGWCSGSLKGA